MTEDNYMTPLVEILRQLRDRGYTCDFELIEDGLLCRDKGEVYKAGDLTIERYYRFEGDSSADDMAVLYGISTNSGLKGVIIDAYGAYDNSELAAFLKDVRVEESE